MNFDEHVFFSLSLGLSFINLCTMCILFYLLQSHIGYHRNLRILLLILNEAFGCIALSNFLTAILNLARKSIEDFQMEEKFLSSMSNYGTNLASVVFIALIVERAAATAYRRIYEKTKSICWLLISIFVCQTVALGMSALFTLYLTNYYIQATIILSLDLISIAVLITLYCANSSLRKMDIQSDITLSQRYQVNENIRSIYTIMQLILVGVFFSIFGTTATVIQNFISSALRLRMPIYHLIMNVYVFLAFFIAIRRDSRLRHGFFLFTHCGHEDKSTQIAPAKIKNVFGKSIINDNSTQAHFKSLDTMWH